MDRSGYDKTGRSAYEWAWLETVQFERAERINTFRAAYT